MWNSLANYVISSVNTTNMFGIRLDNFWQSQDIVYDIEAQIYETRSSSVL